MKKLEGSSRQVQYFEIWKGSGAKSRMRKDYLLYEEIVNIFWLYMRVFFIIFDSAHGPFKIVLFYKSKKAPRIRECYFQNGLVLIKGSGICSNQLQFEMPPWRMV
jgi:hypothetical protein